LERIVIERVLEAYLHRTPDFLGKWRALAPFAFLVNDTPVKTRYGHVKLGLDVPDRTNRFAILGGYGSFVANQIAHLKEGDCFIDVGANCGLFTILAARKVGLSGLVLAFEPCMKTFAKLARNVAINGLHNVVMTNVALGQRSGRALLDVSARRHSGRHFLTDAETGHAEMVTQVDLTGSASAAGVIGDRPVLIKIDVEGAELLVLRSLSSVLSRPRTSRVVVEIDEHNLGRFGANAADVYSYLDEFGFEPARRAGMPGHFDQLFERRAA
jgi:FkbM family methyltransferase